VKDCYIIATTYESLLNHGTTFYIETNGTEYETEGEIKADFDEWNIKHEAKKLQMK